MEQRDCSGRTDLGNGSMGGTRRTVQGSTPRRLLLNYLGLLPVLNFSNCESLLILRQQHERESRACPKSNVQPFLLSALGGLECSGNGVLRLHECALHCKTGQSIFRLVRNV